MKRLSSSKFFMNISMLRRYALFFLRSLLIFKNPLVVIWSYVIRKTPPSKEISLRNGTKIYLSSHQHDVTTVFLIFARQEYMKIERDSIVLDIGANIGAFSLFAAQYKPKKIYAVEPSLEAYNILQRNIISNKLENVIKPYWNFLAAKDDLEVNFPIKSSPYNELSLINGAEEVAQVSSITLQKLIESNNIEKVDYLKIDCEGCEYDVFLNMDGAIFHKIKNIVMEYHRGPLDELISYFNKHGFCITYQNTYGNILWLTKI